jgi:uncharacterized damage-inducible protein DinB
VTHIQFIIDQLRRSIQGEAWHGPSVEEVVRGMDASTAAAHPVQGVHSIWEVLNHVSAWIEAVNVRLTGGAIELEGERDWPPVAATADDKEWNAARDTLAKRLRRLIETLETLNDEDLDAAVPDRDHNRAHMLAGLIQHNAYHAGQMALLKRAAAHR